MSSKNGLLLSNLGSPDAPTAAAVRPYLKQFLTDPRVLDMPWIMRQLIVRGIIAPFRSHKSAHAYSKVWTPEGSPLVVNTRRLTEAVSDRLGDGWKVAMGMRYGKPSLETALKELVDAGCDMILLLPLYPQYAPVTSGSTVEELWRVAKRMRHSPSKRRVLPPFPVDPGFIGAQSDLIAPLLTREPDEHVLFSFHGVPERHIRKADATGKCLTDGCCAGLTEANHRCYKAQCHATAWALAANLRLADGSWSVSFQSRLGRDAWIGPSTEQVAKDLALAGCQKLVVSTPAFVADCLETLEEVGMGLKATFLASGGKQFSLARCVNSDEVWVGAVVDMATSYLEQQP
ncbi:MAG: hypothetical protein RL173_3590 [Fibrobacterota bacterium]|jgi:ferrochelatase